MDEGLAEGVEKKRIKKIQKYLKRKNNKLYKKITTIGFNSLKKFGFILISIYLTSLILIAYSFHFLILFSHKITLISSQFILVF